MNEPSQQKNSTPIKINGGRAVFGSRTMRPSVAWWEKEALDIIGP